MAFKKILTYHVIFLALGGCTPAESGYPFPRLTLAGRIDENMLKQLKEKAPLVKTLIITSQGGDIEPAIVMGRLVRQNNIEIVVRKYCLSACSQIILPAASKATIEDKAILGTHRSPLTIYRYLKNSPLSDDAQQYYKKAMLEEEYYEYLGVDTRYMTQLYGFNQPVCVGRNLKADSELTGMMAKYRWTVPNFDEYVAWSGVKITGKWAQSRQELIESYEKHIPKSVSLSIFPQRGRPLNRVIPSLPLCETTETQNSTGRTIAPPASAASAKSTPPSVGVYGYGQVSQGSYTLQQRKELRMANNFLCKQAEGTRGRETACYNLAEMMATGSGGEADVEGSRKILSGLCDKGFKLACKTHPR